MSNMRRAAVAAGLVVAGSAAYVGLSVVSVAATDIEQCPRSAAACAKPLWIQNASVQPGTMLRYSGDTFAPHRTVRLTFDDPSYVNTVIVTDAHGRAEGETRVPAQAAVGSHRVVMAGVDGYGRPLVERAVVTVRRSASAHSSAVAEAVLTLGGTALTLGLAAGAILTAVWRRSPGRAQQAPALTRAKRAAASR